jgi:DnaJ like chaperone protein
MTIWNRLSAVATAIGSRGQTALTELGSLFGFWSDAADGGPESTVKFTIAVVALSAKMARADGVVVPIEVETFHKVFQAGPDELAGIERIFRIAQADVAGYEAYADQIGRMFANDRLLLRDVLEGLYHIATADRVLHPQEHEFLKKVATRLGLTASEHREVRSYFIADPDNPYDILGVYPSITDENLKARYRSLVQDNHPDRLIARGVPSEFIDVATRKLAAINAAYDVIAKERGL